MDESKYEITNKIYRLINTSTDLGCILLSIFDNNRKQLLNILSISRSQSMYAFIQGIKDKIKQHPIDEKKRKETDITIETKVPWERYILNLNTRKQTKYIPV